MQKLLTICTAAYNAEKYIDNMASSILCSKYIDDIELILVNDGSTDHTLELMNKYKTQCPDSVKVIDKMNGGAGSARNTAFSVATGKYIKIIDADDWVKTDGLNKFMERLQTLDVDMILSPHFVYSANDRKNEKESLVDVYSDIDSDVSELSNFFTSVPLFYMHGITFKTTIFANNNLRFTEGVSYTDAEYVTLPIPFVHSVALIKQPFYVYQVGLQGQSVDNNIALKKNKDRWIVLQRLISVAELCQAGKMVPDQIHIINTYMESLACGIVVAYIVDGGSGHRKELKQADQQLKSLIPEVYKQLVKYKRIFILRMTNYYGYYFLRLHYRIKYGKKQK